MRLVYIVPSEKKGPAPGIPSTGPKLAGKGGVLPRDALRVTTPGDTTHISAHIGNALLAVFIERDKRK